MEKVTEYFGSMVFDDRIMKATLSEKVYKHLRGLSTGAHRWIYP